MSEISQQQMEQIKTGVSQQIAALLGKELHFALILFDIAPAAVMEETKKKEVDVDTFMTVIVRCDPDLFDHGICALADAVMAGYKQETPELH